MEYFDEFRVKPGDKVRLADIDPGFTDSHYSKDTAREAVAANNQRLRELQYDLYAEGKRSLLICLQAPDAAGKDGVINHVLGAMNPQGCRVEAFKVPSPKEADHDFLWRIHAHTPAKGEVVVFNRSH